MDFASRAELPRKKVRFNLPSPSPVKAESPTNYSPFSSPSRNKKFKKRPPKSPGKSKLINLHIEEEEEEDVVKSLFGGSDDMDA